MRHQFLYLTAMVVCVGTQLFAQCDYDVPPSVKKIQYAGREVTFSEVVMNGKQTTFLAVRPGESVLIRATSQSRKNGDYCPDCIVQIYWGVRGHASVCTKSFHGYQYNRKKSSLSFRAPQRAGIYYVTMGATLDYSCKNNNNRPWCEADKAFAILKVGNPDPAQEITLEKVQNNALRTTMVKPGCFGELNTVEWFLNGEPLSYKNQTVIPLAGYGTYRVRWSNCNTSIERSYNHNADGGEIVTNPPNNQGTANAVIQLAGDDKKGDTPVQSSTGEVAQITLVGNSGPTKTVEEEIEELEDLVDEKDKFVLQHLVFDLQRSTLRPEAKLELNQLADIMKERPNMTILLEGHTDVRGNPKSNLELSEDRVESVKKYLNRRGVNKRRIDTKGWGQQKPLIVTDDVEEGKINRRVEISILSR